MRSQGRGRNPDDGDLQTAVRQESGGGEPSQSTTGLLFKPHGGKGSRMDHRLCRWKVWVCERRKACLYELDGYFSSCPKRLRASQELPLDMRLRLHGKKPGMDGKPMASKRQVPHL